MAITKQNNGQMREIDLAYIAGLVDGEGCVTISKHIGKGFRNDMHYLRLEISNTNKSLMEWIKNYFGIGAIIIKNGKKKQKSIYHWQVCSRQALFILKLLFPYLKLKKEQARLAIGFQSKIKPRSSKHLTTEIIIQRQEYMNKMQFLNKRGHLQWL